MLSCFFWPWYPAMCPLCSPPNSFLWLRHPDMAAAQVLFTVLLQTSFSFMHMNYLNFYFKSFMCFASNNSFWTTIPIWPPWHRKCLLTSKCIIWDILLIYLKNYFCCPDILPYKSFRGSNFSPAFVVLHWTGAEVVNFSSEKGQSWSFRYPLYTYASVWVSNFEYQRMSPMEGFIL